MSSPGQCEKQPELAMQINAPSDFIPALKSVAKQMPELPAGPLVVLLSTDQVFDGNAPPYRESDVPNPLNAYARSKFAMEQLLLEGWAGPKVVLRSSNIIGGEAPLATIKGTKFTQWLQGILADPSPGCSTTVTLEEYKPATLFEDERRSYVYVKDIVSTVFAIIEKFRRAGSYDSLPTVLNMGGPESLTRVDMGERVIEAIGGSLTVRVGDGAKAEDKPKIQPTLRATVNLGYDSPLDISMDSSLLRCELGVEMSTMRTALADALSLSPRGSR
jgi:dTDP-4-dehydrorhamnose reductase